MFKFIFVALTVLILPSYALAQDVPLWEIDREFSEIKIEYDAEGSIGKGAIKKFTGEIKFSPDALDQSFVTIQIPIASLKLDSLEYTRIVLEADWFDLVQFPMAVFQATKFSAVDGKENHYIATGILTIKGQSQFLDLPFSLSFEQGGHVAIMSSELIIQRLAYNLGVGQWANTSTVADDVHLAISLRALRKK